MLKYIPYVLMFAVATMIIYGWGLWRTMHQKQDLSNMLCSKGISKVKKALKKNKSLTKKELEPFFLSHAPHSDHFPFIGSRMIIQFDRIDRIKRMLFFHFFISAMSFH